MNSGVTDDGGYNSGSSTWLYSQTTTRWAALQFDLPHASGESIDTVTSAAVSIVANSNTSSFTGVFNVWRLTEEYDETKTPYGDYYDEANPPAHDSSPVCSFSVLGTGDPGYSVNIRYTIDVKTLLEENGSKETFGILILQPSSPAYVTFIAHELNWNGPRMSAEYTAVPEPATLCLLGLGGIGILVRRRRRLVSA